MSCAFKIILIYWGAANGGLRDGVSSKSEDLRKKAFFLRFLDFPGARRTKTDHRQGCCKNSPQEAQPNFGENLGRQILVNTLVLSQAQLGEPFLGI